MLMLRRSWQVISVAFAFALAAACGGPPPSPTALARTAPPAVSAGEATRPRFTHPTEITNPFYPVSLIGEAISLGTEGGRPYRTEVTLLPGTRAITFDGQQIEARVSQYVAYAGGRLAEVAYDFFAQADDGSVYYLGEEVSNYRAGRVVDHGGSWLAGKNGAPPALIMPTHPEVGQKFNPENLPGVVYETDEILSLTEKTTTPAGPIGNGLLIKEILMDGSVEYKVNAAGFGIVDEREGKEVVSLVWLNRTDAASVTVPEPLGTIEAQAEAIMDVVPDGAWEQVTADVAAIGVAWQAYRTRAASDKVPQPFQDALTAAFDHLQSAAGAKDAAGTAQAANNLSAAVVDLFTVYRPATPTDLGRLDVTERQVALNLNANDFAATADSLAKIDATWARLKPMILAHDRSDLAASFEQSLAAQRTAMEAENASAMSNEANHSLALIDEMETLF